MNFMEKIRQNKTLVLVVWFIVVVLGMLAALAFEKYNAVLFIEALGLLAIAFYVFVDASKGRAKKPRYIDAGISLQLKSEMLSQTNEFLKKAKALNGEELTAAWLTYLGRVCGLFKVLKDSFKQGPLYDSIEEFAVAAVRDVIIDVADLSASKAAILTYGYIECAKDIERDYPFLARVINHAISDIYEQKKDIQEREN